MFPNLASQMRTAFSSMVWNTGSRSPGEQLLILDKRSNNRHITAAGFRQQGCGDEQEARWCRTGNATFRGGAFTAAWCQAGGSSAAAPSEPHVGVAVGTSA